MDSVDLGYDPKTKRHTKMLTSMESVFLSILWDDHQGWENRISSDELAAKFGEQVEGYDIFLVSKLHLAWKRNVRKMQNHLLLEHDHVPVLSKAGNQGGYWLAENKAEAEAFYHSFRKRGLTGLVKATRGKKSAMVDVMTQLSFEFEDLVDKTGLSTRERRISSAVPVQVVDAFLGKMLEKPEEYAAGLRKIAQKYGGVLLPRTKLEEMKKQIAQLQMITDQMVA